MIKIVILIVVNLFLIGCSSHPSANEKSTQVKSASEIAYVYVDSYLHNDFRQALSYEELIFTKPVAETVKKAFILDIRDGNKSMIERVLGENISETDVESLTNIELLTKFSEAFFPLKNITINTLNVIDEERDEVYARVDLQMNFSSKTQKSVVSYIHVYLRKTHSGWGVQNVEAELIHKVLYKRITKQYRRFNGSRYNEVMFSDIRARGIKDMAYKEDEMYQKLKKNIENNPSFDKFTPEQKEKMLTELMDKIQK